MKTKQANVRRRNTGAKKEATGNNVQVERTQEVGSTHQHDHDDEPNVFHIFMVFNVFVAAFIYLVYYLVQNPFYMMSCDATQPLVDIKDNFMDRATFKKLSDCLNEHPLVLGNELSDANFKGTRGFVVKFSEQGIADFRTNKYFKCLAPYFDAARIPGANAFVMNLLICEVGSSDPNSVAVGTHLDNTIGIKSWRTFVAHQVNVLYAVVPDDMQGGDLHVFPFESGRPEDNDKAVERVVPKTNRMVAFKGNAYHRVMSYRTETNLTRVSLVLEQYKVPESYKGRLTRYLFEKREGIVMM